MTVERFAVMMLKLESCLILHYTQKIKCEEY